ncbi:MAG: Major Facilitator Superfamily transporter [Frankiales bacterium]|nr:Major Facilitator Superfamily transporter [Frankiales bacterium]
MRSTHAVRRLVAVRDFRWLLAVRLSGQCADGLLQGALFGAAFFNPDKATSAGTAAAAFAVLLLPYSLIGPFAGVLLDRWSRQRTLLISNAVRAALVALLALTLTARGPTDGTSLLLALVTVSVNRFVLSGLSASLPRVVIDRQLVTANSFTTTLGTAATAVGGIISVQLRHLWGSGDHGAGRIALVAAMGYTATAFVASRIERSRLGPDGGIERAGLRHALGTVARGLLAGARHIRGRRAAAAVLVVIGLHRFFSGLAFVLVLLLYTPDGYLRGGLGHFGETLTAVVAGGLVAAVVTPRIVRRIGGPAWIVLALVLAALVMGVCFPPYTQGWLVVAGVGLGFAAQAAKICVDTLVQESIEDAFRGRVFALYDTLFNVTFVAAAVLAAGIVPDDGHSLAVVELVGVGYLVTAAGYALWLSRSRVAVTETADPAVL